MFTGPKPIQLVVVMAVRAAVRAAMAMRMTVSQRLVLPFFMVFSFKV